MAHDDDNIRQFNLAPSTPTDPLSPPPAADATTQPEAPKPHEARPDICRFTDYRLFLRALVPHLKATRPGFSYRSFAHKAGFSSPNYLKLVTDGQRNLAAESVDKFARGLGLTRREHDIFRLLVLLANARTDEERNALYVRLRERVVDDEVARLRDDQFAVYDHWWALVVREMVNLPGFQLDARWIARRLRPRIRPSQAQRAIDLLTRTGLVALDPDGRARLVERTISTGPAVPEVQGLAVRNYHRAHLELAARSLDEVPREERNVTSVAVTLSRAAYAEAVEEITRLRRRLLELADAPIEPRPGSGEAGAASTREVHQVVVALYPVTQLANAIGGGDASTATDDDDDGAEGA